MVDPIITCLHVPSGCRINASCGFRCIWRACYSLVLDDGYDARTSISSPASPLPPVYPIPSFIPCKFMILSPPAEVLDLLRSNMAANGLDQSRCLAEELDWSKCPPASTSGIPMMAEVTPKDIRPLTTHHRIHAFASGGSQSLWPPMSCTHQSWQGYFCQLWSTTLADLREYSYWGTNLASR